MASRTHQTQVNAQRYPAVDIIVPFHGCYELVTRCLSSILRTSSGQDYTIYLVDDASPNPSYLNSVVTRGSSRIKGVQLTEQLGFAGALEAGFTVGKSPYVLFIHSDCQVDGVHWLRGLQIALLQLRSAGIKLVSARTNSVGTASSFDERLLGDNDPLQHEGLPPWFEAKAPLPLFCALCHRGLFERIGGFVHAYPYGWYEEEELYWRMQHYGYKQGIVTGSFVSHTGGATIAQVWHEQPGSRQIMESNRERCLADLAPLSQKS